MASDHDERSPRSWAQWFCLVGGALLLLRGAVGVIADPAFETPGDGWHQLFHLTSGVILVALSQRASSALAATVGFAAIYAAVTVAGLGGADEVAGLFAIDGSDDRVHAALTAAALGAWAATLVSARAGTRPQSPA